VGEREREREAESEKGRERKTYEPGPWQRFHDLAKP
jgi:hypothetical protein